MPNFASIFSNDSEDKPRKTEGEKKKSFRRSWASSGPFARLTLIVGAIAVAAAAISVIAYIAVSVWQHSQSTDQFTEEHRPHLVISRPPELLDDLSCRVMDKEIYLRQGRSRIYSSMVRHVSTPAASTIKPSLGVQVSGLRISG